MTKASFRVPLDPKDLKTWFIGKSADPSPLSSPIFHAKRDDKARGVERKRSRAAYHSLFYNITPCRPASLPFSNIIDCHPEWEEIFNFHYAGMTGIDYTSMVLW